MRMRFLDPGRLGARRERRAIDDLALRPDRRRVRDARHVPRPRAAQTRAAVLAFQRLMSAKRKINANNKRFKL